MSNDYGRRWDYYERSLSRCLWNVTRYVSSSDSRIVFFPAVNLL
jgi:hypothetical protein